MDKQPSLTELLDQDLDFIEENVQLEVNAQQSLNEFVYADDEQYAFKLGQIAFFFPQDILSEVIEEVEYTHLPLMPNTVLGLSNVRGNLVPVFDMHGFLGVKRSGKQKNLLCIGEGDDMVGVLLDDMPFRLKRSECKALSSAPVLPDSIQPYINQLFIKGDQVILDYQHEALFNALC